ncbi:Hypothetical predicted protein [Cloeon dipterum]|uniref:Uncharacterized protein n=1 Tax=Cloeon dipterum TaxID=197152 RepID=A0A8S1E0W5_9INSE|nr:Hypothetical predicted protein [Cloeon dipterum]
MRCCDKKTTTKWAASNSELSPLAAAVLVAPPDHISPSCRSTSYPRISTLDRRFNDERKRKAAAKLDEIVSPTQATPSNVPRRDAAFPVSKGVATTVASPSGGTFDSYERGSEPV